MNTEQLEQLIDLAEILGQELFQAGHSEVAVDFANCLLVIVRDCLKNDSHGFSTPMGSPKGPLGHMGERGEVIGESGLAFRQAIKYKGEQK